MLPLPIDRSIADVLAALRRSRSLVLVAPPGAGKTTRVPPAVLAATPALLAREHPNLVMLQPRRVAARASAQRIAEENGWGLGREVGYHVRFDRRVGPQTRLRVLTEGILTRQLLDDPFLEGIGAVLLDEFHERSIHTDLCLALLREAQQTVREDLILIVMSATLEAEPVARFLGGCPVVRSEGRTFPVEIAYAGCSQDPVAERAADAVIDLLSNGGDDGGDVLVFLPGVEEIRRAGRRLEGVAQRLDLLVLPLHGSLPPEEQMLALRPSPRRKVILSTNVAETSLTIDGVRTVIDGGFARVAGYDPQRGLDRLELQRISKASAAQRAGRAGRTGPGQCVRLWSTAEERAMADFQEPEVRRVDLCGTVLMLHAWGKPDPRAFGWYEPPPEPALLAAERLLAMLGALDKESAGSITPQGRQLMAVPTHPRLARLLLAASDYGASREGAALAALLSEKDIVWVERGPGVPPSQRGARTLGPSDLLIRLEMLSRAESTGFAPFLRDEGIDPNAARQAAKVRDDLLRIAPSRSAPRAGVGDDAVLKLALLAYPDRVCRRRTSDPAAGAMVGGWGVRLAAESVVRQPEFFLALDARQDERSGKREALVRVASAVDPAWLEEFFPAQVRRERAAVFDEARGRVAGRFRIWYRDLLIRDDEGAAVEPAEAARVLAAAAGDVVDWFARDEGAASFLARVALLRQWMPEHPWPKFEAAELAEALAEASAGKRSLDELRRVPLTPLLASRLVYPLDRLLEQHAPEALTVPTGNRIRLAYATGAAPVLAVRLQEVFGWTDTPRLAGGRVAVLMHLLGPNYRPVQITDDLRSFWSSTYFQVRKDLRTRYPKHAWPEDPLTAKPVAKGRPTR